MSSKRRSGKSPGNPAGRRRTPAQPPVDEGAGIVWIKTEPLIDGSGYMVTLDASEDVSVSLTPAEAFRHAQGILAAAHRAAYDAAVMRQLIRKLHIDDMAAMEFVMSMRKDRPPLAPEDTAPIWLEPGVTRPPEMRPFLVQSVNGEKVGQWDIDQAERHARAVLAMSGVADLDSGYLRALRTIGIEEYRAHNVIDDLKNFREEL